MKTLLLSALILTFSAAPAAAQVAAANTPAPEANQTTERLTHLRGLTDSPVEPLVRTMARQLRASSAVDRAAGLQETVYYVAHFGDLVDFKPLIPALLGVIERDPDPTHRVMASQALCYIGDREALHEMARLARQDRDRQVQRRILYAAAATLAAMK